MKYKNKTKQTNTITHRLFLLSFQRGWNYVIERALDTRPKKVARAIAAHQIGNVADLEKQFQEVLKKKISVEVKWEEFIHANEFVYWLDEPQYLAVLDNVSYLFPLFLSLLLFLYIILQPLPLSPPPPPPPPPPSCPFLSLFFF